MNDDKKHQIEEAENNDQVKEGKKAVETNKKISRQEKTTGDKDKKAADDAEAWHNEG